MRRKAGIDASGMLHHIIGRGIERRRIFWDDADRNWFVERLGRMVSDTGTRVFCMGADAKPRTIDEFLR